MTGVIFRTASQMTALAFLVALATAHDAQARMRGNFGDADSDHDGRVSLQEFEAYATNRLMAANGVTAERFKHLSSQAQMTLLEQRFDRMDRAHKGYIDQNDWTGS